VPAWRAGRSPEEAAPLRQQLSGASPATAAGAEGSNEALPLCQQPGWASLGLEQVSSAPAAEKRVGEAGLARQESVPARRSAASETERRRQWRSEQDGGGALSSSLQVMPDDDKGALPTRRSRRSAIKAAGECEGAGEKSEEFWIHTPGAQMIFDSLIVLNAVVVGIETDHRADADNGAGWIFIECVFLSLFLLELCLRVRAERAAWILSPWNVFDALLVAIGAVSVCVFVPMGNSVNIRFLTLFRLLRLVRLMRVFRLGRLIQHNRELRLLVAGIGGAFRAMVWGLSLLFALIYVCALVVTRLVGRRCCLDDSVFNDAVAFPPEDGAENENAGMYWELFGTMPRTMFTLFQFAAEFQPDICRATWGDGFPGLLLTAFLIAFAGLSNIVLLNIIASVIVDVVCSLSAENRQEEIAKRKEKYLQKVEEEVDELLDTLEIGDDEDFVYNDLSDKKAQRGISKVFREAGLLHSDVKELLEILDPDSIGVMSSKKWRDSLLRLKRPPDSKDLLSIEASLDSLEGKVDKFVDMHAEVMRAIRRIESRP